MALFGKKKEDKKKETAVAEAPAKEKKAAAPAKSTAAPKKTGKAAAYGILLKPRFTEKAAQLAEFQNAYAFEVGADVSKQQVKEAVETVYKVTPTKVAMVKYPKKQVRSRKGKTGTKGGGKKAYVYLKKGDTIELM